MPIPAEVFTGRWASVPHPPKIVYNREKLPKRTNELQTRDNSTNDVFALMAKIPNPERRNGGFSLMAPVIILSNPNADSAERWFVQ